jgi:hypothetical protein
MQPDTPRPKGNPIFVLPPYVTPSIKSSAAETAQTSKKAHCLLDIIIAQASKNTQNLRGPRETPGAPDRAGGGRPPKTGQDGLSQTQGAWFGEKSPLRAGNLTHQ